MSANEQGVRSQGNQADYVLGTSEGWGAFQVVRWHGIEELSQPFRFDITLMRQADSGPADLDRLLDAGATFRVASQSRWRTIHGVLAEAEEIDRTGQLFLYRVLLVPHFWRARYRRHCRNFVGKTLREIVSAVLENRSPARPEGAGGLVKFSSAQGPDLHPDFTTFSEPKASYRWDVAEASRIDDANARPYVTQYNESDFDFVARLLEDEGLTYLFEHGRDEVTLAITDAPGHAPMFDSEEKLTLRRVSKSGRNDEQEIIRSIRDPRRLASRAVTVRDWDYHRSLQPLQASVDEASGDPELSRYFEFPVGEESIQDRPGMHAASVRMERCDVERSLREGISNVRTMVPGYRFDLHDGDGLIADAKLLAVRVETFATELAPQQTILDEEPFGFAGATGTPTASFDSRFVALPEKVPFRPAMRTGRPRIHGVQAAVVTAEEHPEADRPAINADKLGRVRVRFPWDQHADTDDKTPTSDWIRVSQFWAGTGYGALYTPRVGHEVLVAYMQGDPDRPVIVGRVYNPQHPPPYDASKDPTKSTVKSRSAEAKKEVDGFNEIRFEDRAKHEEIFLHAQRDLNEVVLASHSTTVGGCQSNTVGQHQTNTVKGHREHTIGDYESVTVGGDRTTLFKANEDHKVEGFRTTTIGANETLSVVGFRKSTIAADDDLTVGGWRNVLVGGGDTLNVIDKRDVKIGASYTVNTGVDYASEAGNNHVFKSTGAHFEQSSEFVVQAAGCTLSMKAGTIVLDNGAGASVVLAGGLVHVTAGRVGVMSGPISMMASGNVDIVAAGGNVNVVGGEIKLNG
jgi:type VI secretion system secreted protein VgrG